MKKKLFMLNKLFLDLRRSLTGVYQISNVLNSEELKEYYFIFDEKRISKGKGQNLLKKIDKNGIPLNKTYIDVTEKDYVYFPITIGQLGLAVFHTYLKSKSNRDKKRFLKFADWFLENVEISNDLGAIWKTKVSLPQYKNPGPWQSAFSQSRAISILLRGYQLTQNEKYAEVAEKALIPFLHPVAKGGITSYTKWGPFYEEYTASVPTLVFNGMIFSLLGVYDFLRVFPNNSNASKIFNDGIETLTKITSEYDIGYWSRYNLCLAPWYPDVDPSTIRYQQLHILQLELLYKLTNIEFFKNYKVLFKNQLKMKNIIKMYITKYKSLKKIGRL